MWTDADVPGRDHVESARWGVAPSIAFGTGTPTRVTLSYFNLKQDNLPDYGMPWVPANTIPSSRPTPTARRRSISRTSTGWSIATTRTTDTDLATARSRTTSAGHRRSQPDALGAERPRLGDHRAAIRGGQHEHGDQPPAPVARHDRRHPGEPDQPTVALRRPAVGHVDRRRLESPARSVNFARTGPTAPPPTCTTRTRSIPIPDRSCAPARAPTAPRIPRRPMRSTP